MSQAVPETVYLYFLLCQLALLTPAFIFEFSKAIIDIVCLIVLATDFQSFQVLMHLFMFDIISTLGQLKLRSNVDRLT